MPQAIEASVKTAIATRNTRRGPKRSAIQPLAGINAAAPSRYTVTAPVSASGVTPRLTAMLGSEVLRMAPSSSIMNSAAATINATRRVGAGLCPGVCASAVGMPGETFALSELLGNGDFCICAAGSRMHRCVVCLHGGSDAWPSRGSKNNNGHCSGRQGLRMLHVRVRGDRNSGTIGDDNFGEKNAGGRVGYAAGIQYGSYRLVMFYNLHLLRIVAALGVVYFHITSEAGLNLELNVGSRGVDVFFVISGFIIAQIGSAARPDTALFSNCVGPALA